MEFLELLRLLADEKNNATLQEQIDLLREASIYNLKLNTILIIVVILLFGSYVVYVEIRQKRLEKRLDQIEKKLEN